MAWKLRKDKLKAGAPETEASPAATDTAATVTANAEKAPVFDLSGSAFQTAPVASSEEEPEIPSFLDDAPPLGLTAQPSPAEAADVELIDLEPLPVIHSAAKPTAEVSFQPEPLPEFDPILAPAAEAAPERVVIAPAAFSTDTEAADPPRPPAGHEESATFYQNLSPEREAIASGLVTMETETGLPRVAPFILDTPAPVNTPEPPRMHSVVIRIGKLSATHFLTKDVTTIGRPDGVVQNYPDVEIELDDGISRRHAEIRHDGTGYVLVDVGSTNGTVLNGEMLTPHQPAALHPGDQIRLGERTELLFE